MNLVNKKIKIDYFAVLMIDIPNILKKGQILNFSRKTIFVFEDNNILKPTVF